MTSPPRRRDRAHTGVDTAVLWRLGALRYQLGPVSPPEAVSAQEFWDRSRVSTPAPVTVAATWANRRSVEMRLEGPSEGPGDHPGATKLIATAHIRTDLTATAPLILMLHGFAVPMPLWDALQARRLRAMGAHTVRLDLPMHLRRRPPGRNSGDEFFGADPARTLASVRQAVEDAAAIVAWARAEVTPTVAVLGVSLGGLITCLLASQVELDAVVAVAPLCDPPETFIEHMPPNLARRLGLVAGSGGIWGADRDEARALLDGALAPLVLRRLRPRTPGSRVTLVRPLLDRIVGPHPIADLAAAWGTELWDYRCSHITVMNAPGVGRRVRERLIERCREAVTPDGASLVPAAG